MTQLELIKIEQGGVGPTKRLRIIPTKKIKTDKVRPFLRYPGSKYNASKYIAPFWSSVKFQEYREPFLGSGAIFFKMPKVEKTWLNDIDKDLINVFRVISSTTSREKLIRKIEGIKPTKELFEKLKYWKPSTDLDKAYRYFVVNRTAYSGIMNLPNWGFHPTKSVQPDKWADRIRSSGKKLEGDVKITNKPFLDIIKAKSKNRVWMFVDPPYFKADQKRAYLHSFTYKDHMELLHALKHTKHLFCLTYDNCDEIKRLYSWANVHEIDWMYHTANSNVTKRKMGRELIITNYEIPQEPNQVGMARLF